MDKRKKAKKVAEGTIAYLEKRGMLDSLDLVIEYLQLNLKDSGVKVYVPKKLNLKEKQNVKKMVIRLIGEDIKKMDFIEDPNIIDGMKIEYKDRLWNFTLASQIQKLTEREI
jgi:F0F1-type ATP synthase delta subunit